MINKHKVCIIGAGKYGTAIGNVCSQSEHLDITFWARNQEVVDQINQNHVNPKVFNNYTLKNNINATSSLDLALKDAKLVKIILLRYFTLYPHRLLQILQ